MSDLEPTIAAWRRSLRTAGLRDEQLAELEDHLRCSIALAIDAGRPAAEAFTAACAHLGAPEVLAAEFQQEKNMHPLSKLLGLAIAIAAMCTVIEIEGGYSTMLLALPPLLMVLGISFGGLVASHGPTRVLRMLAIAFAGRCARPGEAEELRSICRRGHRLAYAAGVLQAVLGAINICSHLNNPSLIGPGIAYTLIGLVHAVLVAELGFATAERWVAGAERDLEPAS